MRTTGDDVSSRIVNGVRYYARVLVVSVLVTTLAALIIAATSRSDLVYESEALIVPRHLGYLEGEDTPQLYAAVFDSGAVERGVEAHVGPLQPGERLVVEPLEDAVVARVVGWAPTPVRAARLTNSAAGAFISELNEAGPGLGVFIVQDRAAVPDDPLPSQALPFLALALGPVAGVAVGLGIIGLILALRQPVLSPVELRAVADVPVMATSLPARGQPSSPEFVPAIGPLLTRLFPEQADTRVFVSHPRDSGVRARLSLLVSWALARTVPVLLVAQPRQRDPELVASGFTDADLQISDRVPSMRTRGQRATLIDGIQERTEEFALELADAQAVLVVVEGTPLADLETMMSEFLPEELACMVFVSRSGERPSGALDAGLRAVRRGRQSRRVPIP